VPDRKALVYKGCPPDHCCCDSTLRILPNGEYAVFFLTGGPVEPHPENYIGLVRSREPDVAWSKEPEAVLRFPDRAGLLSEVIVEGDTITILAHTHKGMFKAWENWTLTSSDNGATWSELKAFDPMPRRAFFRTLVRTTWGEWLLPFQLYAGSEWEKSPWDDGTFKIPQNGVLISSDRGRTWDVSAPTNGAQGWAENMVAELSDHSLVMLVRSDGDGCLLRSDSQDRGRTWTPFAKTDIPNPGTKFKLFRLTDGRIALLHNPNSETSHPNSRPQCQCNRNPLALWISEDDMQTWGHKRVLTDFPGMLAYPDGVVDEKEEFIHFAFDYNRHDVIYWGACLPD